MVVLLYDEAGEPFAFRCDSCGAEAPFDQALPFVEQSAGFLRTHPCRVLDEAGQR